MAAGGFLFGAPGLRTHSYNAGFALRRCAMLPLDLPGILVAKTEPDDRLFAIHAGCEGRPVACVTCGSQNFIGHGQHQQEVMDLPHQGKLTCIHLLRKRYRCKDCSDTFFHPLDWLDDDHHASKCEFQAKLDTDSSATWTVIPTEAGHRFQGKLDSWKR